MQLPGSFAEGPEEVGAWSVEDGTPVLLEDFEGFEYVFVTETADGMRVSDLLQFVEQRCWAQR
jgi:hypothetical protein